ncbi:MAG: hypothetical protein EON54_24675 [Alcaligenaceae bacterium]|nr:MAG: hypothetical protein EON54_24675 [Alcaligenaceae bacterium]
MVRLFKALMLILAMSVSACGGILGDSGVNAYIGSSPTAKGPVSLGPTYSFKFIEKWRISHAWIQGADVGPCYYRGNVFKRFPEYPAFAGETEGPMFERDGRIYFGGALPKNRAQIVFFELSYQFLGESPKDRKFEGKYKPFCGQFFSTPNGMTLSIVKPDPAKGTDEWIAGAVPTQVNGRTWLVKKLPPKDLGPTSERAQTMEYWTLKIPGTSYWMNVRFSGSRRSVEEYSEEHNHLLNVFHQVIDSVKLEPITPVDPTSMPPFILAY